MPMSGGCGVTRHSGAKRAISDLHWFRYQNRQLVRDLNPEICVSNPMVIGHVEHHMRDDGKYWIYDHFSMFAYMYALYGVLSHVETPMSNSTRAPAGSIITSNRAFWKPTFCTILCLLPDNFLNLVCSPICGYIIVKFWTNSAVLLDN